MVVETEAAQIVEIAGRTVEQTHDDAFAEQRRQRGNAEIDLAAENADLDAAVLRQAAFGDVELRHQLQARDDGGFQFARRLLLIEEHAIHAEADAEFLLERLDVNVAGALLDGLRDHGVDQPDDGRFARHVAQVFEIVFVAAGEIGCGGLAVAFAVIAVDRVENILLGGELRT